MPEPLIFGITHKQISMRMQRKLDRICKDYGGHGFTWAMFSDGPKGWFTGPNLGYPHDRELRQAVLAAAKREGVEL
jgi:hypothetical protein